MSNFVVNNEEMDQLANIFSKHGMNELVEKINKEKESNKDVYYIERMYLFNHTYVTLNTNDILKALYDYTKDKPFNIGHFFEHQILHGHNWNDEFSGYMRLVKNTDYPIKENDRLYPIIHKQYPSTQNIFWGLVTLAPLIKDNATCTKAFHLILNDKITKMSSFGLLQIEKIERAWNRRFKGIDPNTLPQDEYQYILGAFNKAENGKTQSFCTSTSGNYLNISVNMDLVSQANKKSKNANNEALHMFFNCFSSFIKKNHNDGNQLSLSSVEVKSAGYDIDVLLCYQDNSNTALIKSIFDDLISHAITKDKDGKLQGIHIKEYNAAQFFTSFIMNYILENDLDKKTETNKKKNKI